MTGSPTVSRVGVVVVGLGLMMLVPGFVAAGLQFRLLDALIAALGNSEIGFHAQTMDRGIRRLILFDRLSPPLTAVVAGMAVYVMASESLHVPRTALTLMLLLGATPLVVQRWVELMAVFQGVDSINSVSQIIDLPRVWSPGPFGPVFGTATWTDEMDRRVNVFTGSSILAWTIGLRIQTRRPEVYLLQPLGALAFACFVTMSLGGVAVRVILRGV